MSDRALKIPLIEHYGPVLQGEGLLIGRPTYFVRLGACDYVCKKCDSMMAVDPKQIEQEAEVMSAAEIADRVLDELRRTRVRLVTLSGGNPALWDMTAFVERLHEEGHLVAIETQGTVYKPWIAACDFVTISPKGPGMIDDWREGLNRFRQFLNALETNRESHWAGVTVKIPVFSRPDLYFAREVIELLNVKFMGRTFRRFPVYLSHGNDFPPGQSEIPEQDLTCELIQSYNRMADIILSEYPDLTDCAFLPQLHVWCHGNERGK
jgi:7-carboxy-7-deazaguanine synthase